MNARLSPHLPDDEVLWFLEEEGLLPMRPIRERWPELFAVPPSIRPGQITEYCRDPAGRRRPDHPGA